MFAYSTPFGQSSNRPFGPPSVFGQGGNSVSNNPFGSHTQTQRGTSIFGGTLTSTGVFGSSTPAFAASSSPAFGASSTTTFGSSSSSFGGSSVFGQTQKPVFGAFGSSPTQTSPYGSGSTSQPSQPAFGNSLFGSSTPFGAMSTSAFAAATASMPAFGATSTVAFGSTSSPAFGVSSTPMFGSGGAFGASSTPAFGLLSTGFGASSSNPAFGNSSTPAFGASSTPAFRPSSTPTFGFASSPAFSQSTSTFGSSPFASSTSPFGAQSSMFGAQSITPTIGGTGFGQSGFGGQRGGSRVCSYALSPELDNSNSGTGSAVAKLVSISAMPVYKDRSIEELRWEDFQKGDKGGPVPAAQSSGVNFVASTSQSSLLVPSQTFGQSSSSLLSTSTSSSVFAPKTPVSSSTGFAASSTTFSSSSNLFTSTSPMPSIYGTISAPYAPNSSSSLFASTSPGFAPSALTAPVQGSAPTFNPSVFNSSATPAAAAQAGTVFGQTTSSFGPSATPFSQSGIFSTPSTGFLNVFSSPGLATSTNTLSFNQTAPSFSTPFPSAQPAQTAFSSGFGSFSQTQSANPSSGAMVMFNNTGLLSATQSSAVIQPVLTLNPFGTLPALPQMSIGHGGTAPSIQYGISSIPVRDKPAPVRVSSLLTTRHLSQRWIRLPARKYNPKNDGTKVPFFRDGEETARTPKADALFLPRENPRALVIRQAEQWSLKSSADKAFTFKDTSPVHENGKFSEEAHPAFASSNSEDKEEDPLGDRVIQEKVNLVKVNQKLNGVHDDHSIRKGDPYMMLSGHRAGESAIAYEHGVDIEALMPKLQCSDYYTEPQIQELAAKERAEPGFCRHVKDFVVGRHGYGSIKFLGETDVRWLDLESLVRFNNREVIVYMDDSKKPPVGQGLNKPAEVTLLNIKCFDKKTGCQYTDGPKIEKYKEMLKRKAQEQGAEFLSYYPVKGEWKFQVNHFSGYKLREKDEDGFNT